MFRGSGSISLPCIFTAQGTESSSQKDLHKELSALRISLENVTVLRTASNISQVTWKVICTLCYLLHNAGGGLGVTIKC